MTEGGSLTSTQKCADKRLPSGVQMALGHNSSEEMEGFEAWRRNTHYWYRSVKTQLATEALFSLCKAQGGTLSYKQLNRVLRRGTTVALPRSHPLWRPMDFEVPAETAKETRTREKRARPQPSQTHRAHPANPYRDYRPDYRRLAELDPDTLGPHVVAGAVD